MGYNNAEIYIPKVGMFCQNISEGFLPKRAYDRIAPNAVIKN